ncbi:MAG: hypothetical protein QN189_03370 [Armatimonadota bacterium]|nr:hypothetical protein [Armatimonadota bacterium]
MKKVLLSMVALTLLLVTSSASQTVQPPQSPIQQPALKISCYHAVKVKDILIAPEPFKVGQPLQITAVLEVAKAGEYFADEFKQKCVLPAEYLTIILTYARSDGKQESLGPHGMSTNSAILLSSWVGDEKAGAAVLKGPGDFPVAARKTVRLPVQFATAGSCPPKITEVTVEAALWKSLDVGGTFWAHKKKWKLQELFYPESR